MQFLATSSSVVILCYTLQCNIWTDRSWFDECCCLVDSTDFSHAFSVPSFFSPTSSYLVTLLFFIATIQRTFWPFSLRVSGFKVKIVFLEYISADLTL